MSKLDFKREGFENFGEGRLAEAQVKGPTYYWFSTFQSKEWKIMPALVEPLSQKPFSPYQPKTALNGKGVT
jgi:hypothetical protein